MSMSAAFMRNEGWPATMAAPGSTGSSKETLFAAGIAIYTNDVARLCRQGRRAGEDRLNQPDFCCGSKLGENSLGQWRRRIVFSMPPSERSCQHNRLLHRRNRDGSSTRKLAIGVFTQP